jgi:hypothetical protein
MLQPFFRPGTLGPRLISRKLWQNREFTVHAAPKADPLTVVPVAIIAKVMVMQETSPLMV